MVRSGALLALIGALGCPHKDGTPPGDDDDDDDTSPTLPPIAIVAGPTIRANPSAGLTAWLDVTLEAEAGLEIDVTGPARSWTVTSPPAVSHSVLLLGLRAAVTHDVVVRVVDGLGNTLSQASTTVTPDPLPADFFPWTVNVANTAAMEPGATLVGFGHYLVVLDPEGQAIWYVPINGAIHEANRLANGNLIVLVNRTTITEFDLSGALIAQWRAAGTASEPATAIPVPIDAMHHDVHELPDGNFVTLSIERRTIDDYPTSEFVPGATASAWVAGDIVVEFTPDGQVVHSYPLLDVLDPTRVAYDAIVGNYWEDFPPWVGDDVKDWSHGNAVSYDAPSDTFLVSLRHQDAVVGIARQTGDLKWILAPQANWQEPWASYVLSPISAGYEPAYHQHGAKFSPSGTVMLFDNGNNRASAYEPQLDEMLNYSRGLEVAIDPVAMTVSEVWSYGKDLNPSLYAGSLGDADPMQVTGNHLITFGNIANPALGGVRLLEVTPSDEVVFDLTVPYNALTTYRCERIAGMMPGL